MKFSFNFLFYFTFFGLTCTLHFDDLSEKLMCSSDPPQKKKRNWQSNWLPRPCTTLNVAANPTSSSSPLLRYAAVVVLVSTGILNLTKKLVRNNQNLKTI